MTERKQRNRKNDHAVLVNQNFFHPVSLYLNNSSLARKTYGWPDKKNAADLKKGLLETPEKRIHIDLGGYIDHSG